MHRRIAVHVLVGNTSVAESFMQLKVRGWFPLKRQELARSAHTHTSLTGEVGGRWEGTLKAEGTQAGARREGRAWRAGSADGWEDEGAGRERGGG